MDTVFCEKCQTFKPASDFKSKDGNTTYKSCRDCRRAYSRQWMRKRKRPTHKDIWSTLRRAMGNCCARCRYDEFKLSLEFYSIAERDPAHGVLLSNMVNRYVYGPSEKVWKQLLDRLSGHVLLCANCRQALLNHEWEIDGDNRLVIGLHHRPEPPDSHPLPIST